MERTSTMKQNQPAACLLPPPSQTTGHGFAETTKRITSPPPVFVLGQHPEGSTHLPGTMLPCQVLQAVLQAAPGDKTAPCHQQTTHGGVEQRCRSSDLIPGRAASSLLLQITPLSTASIFSRGTLIRKFKKKKNPECGESTLQLFLHLMCCISCPSWLTPLRVGHFLKAAAEQRFTCHLVVICPAPQTPMPVMIRKQFFQRWLQFVQNS